MTAARTALALLALPLLHACATGPASSSAAQPAPPPPTVGGNCDAAAGQFALGSAFDAALQEQVRTRTGSRVARPIRPGQAVTMDYSDQRVNIEIDAGNKVTRVRCG